jgi:hypothetical protein
VGEQITAAEGQGLTLDYLGGWHRFTPDKKALEGAWRVLYGIPDSMTHLLTSPEMQWALVIWQWEWHRHGSSLRAGEAGGGDGEKLEEITLGRASYER